MTSFNSGPDFAAEVGSVMHMSINDRETGVQLGERLAAHGVEDSILCVLHEAQNTGLVDRCEGIAEGFGGPVEQFDASATGVADLAGSAAAINSKLAEGGFGAVVVLNQGLAPGLAGLDVVTASYASDDRLFAQMAQGELDFYVFDFAPLQGFMSVTNAFFVQWISFFVDLTGSPPIIVSVEPLIYDQDNALEILFDRDQ